MHSVAVGVKLSCWSSSNLNMLACSAAVAIVQCLRSAMFYIKVFNNRWLQLYSSLLSLYSVYYALTSDSSYSYIDISLVPKIEQHQ